MHNTELEFEERKVWVEFVGLEDENVQGRLYHPYLSIALKFFDIYELFMEIDKLIWGDYEQFYVACSKEFKKISYYMEGIKNNGSVWCTITVRTKDAEWSGMVECYSKELKFCFQNMMRLEKIIRKITGELSRKKILCNLHNEC